MKTTRYICLVPGCDFIAVVRTADSLCEITRAHAAEMTGHEKMVVYDRQAASKRIPEGVQILLHTLRLDDRLVAMDSSAVVDGRTLAAALRLELVDECRRGGAQVITLTRVGALVASRLHNDEMARRRRLEKARGLR